MPLPMWLPIAAQGVQMLSNLGAQRLQRGTDKENKRAIEDQQKAMRRSVGVGNLVGALSGGKFNYQPFVPDAVMKENRGANLLRDIGQGVGIAGQVAGGISQVQQMAQQQKNAQTAFDSGERLKGLQTEATQLGLDMDKGRLGAQAVPEAQRNTYFEPQNIRDAGVQGIAPPPSANPLQIRPTKAIMPDMALQTGTAARDVIDNGQRFSFDPGTSEHLGTSLAKNTPQRLFNEQSVQMSEARPFSVGPQPVGPPVGPSIRPSKFVTPALSIPPRAAPPGAEGQAFLAELNNQQAQARQLEIDRDLAERGIGVQEGTLGVRKQEAANRASQYEQQTQRFNNTLRKAMESEAAGNLEGVMKQENTLRKEYQGLSKDFTKVRNAYGRILAVVETPSAAGDLALIFNYMKMLDPNSVVRESEFATAQNAGSVPDVVRNTWNRMLEGERLGETRQDFVTQAQNLYNAQIESQTQLMQGYQGLASRQGLNIENIAFDMSLPDVSAAAAVAGFKVPDDDFANMDDIIAERERRTRRRSQIDPFSLENIGRRFLLPSGQTQSRPFGVK